MGRSVLFAVGFDNFDHIVQVALIVLARCGVWIRLVLVIDNELCRVFCFCFLLYDEV